MTLVVPNITSDSVFSQAEVNYLQSLVAIVAAESAGYGTLPTRYILYSIDFGLQAFFSL